MAMSRRPPSLLVPLKALPRVVHVTLVVHEAMARAAKRVYFVTGRHFVDHLQRSLNNTGDASSSVRRVALRVPMSTALMERAFKDLATRIHELALSLAHVGDPVSVVHIPCLARLETPYAMLAMVDIVIGPRECPHAVALALPPVVPLAYRYVPLSHRESS